MGLDGNHGEGGVAKSVPLWTLWVGTQAPSADCPLYYFVIVLITL